MKSLFGSPGKINGLVLRTCQCLFAAASLSVMASASSGFSTSTSFWYMGVFLMYSVYGCFFNVKLDV
ncbi:hypothetical protein HanRHA438_Chr11g0529591 [Helianthus annuus]|nr:hypothetical protein HanRHA438_Chr11g0529591 [Helianthus annuus]